MDSSMNGVKIIIFRDDLQIHYCDPITLESMPANRISIIRGNQTPPVDYIM